MIAIGLNRSGFGLGLIVAFSIGLAAVLIGLGIGLVRARFLVDRFGDRTPRWSRALPLVSAGIVTVLGGRYYPQRAAHLLEPQVSRAPPFSTGCAMHPTCSASRVIRYQT